MKFLYVSHPHHSHARNVARALLECNFLGAWYSGLIFSSKLEKKWQPQFIRQKISRRIISEVPSGLIKRFWFWEMMRLGLTKCGLGRGIEDRFWELEELGLDQRAARDLHKFDGIIGFEHGCLGALKEAKRINKKGIVIFASPQHLFFKKWVLPELKIHREWADNWSEELITKRSVLRDERRDNEAHLADIVYANSELTAKSLIDAGIESKKIEAIPLGLYSKIETAPYQAKARFRFMYSGPISLRKGFCYLQEAFLKLKTEQAELHVYGRPLVNKKLLANHPQIYFYGNVSSSVLKDAYAQSDILIFPTLCDGFGQVVGEALSHGLPVICSENAGAVQFITNGINGFRVPAANVSALYDSMQYCLDHRDQMMKMRDLAKKSAGNWSWDDFRKNWIRPLVSLTI